MLETIIEQHPNHKIIIGGDFDTELKGVSPFDQHWFGFLTKNQLASCLMCFPPDSVTYHHESLDKKKWNDHFLVSSAMIGSDLSSYAILHEGDNASDHYPILMSLSANIQTRYQESSSPDPTPTFKWDKLSNEQRSNYTTRLQSLVEALPPPPTAVQCVVKCRCREYNCLDSLLHEYDNLIMCMRALTQNYLAINQELKKTGGPRV